MATIIVTEDIKEMKEEVVEESYCFVSNDIVEWVKELGLYETLT